jgi:hypothetical protein
MTGVLVMPNGLTSPHPATDCTSVNGLPSDADQTTAPL